MEKFNIEEEYTTCPACGMNRFWLKFYCGKVIHLCSDCGYWEEI